MEFGAITMQGEGEDERYLGMSSVAGTCGPLFRCAWLERNSDRLSFVFNLIEARTTSTTNHSRYPRLPTLQLHPKYCRSLSPAN
jgi:hypothetical protein